MAILKKWTIARSWPIRVRLIDIMIDIISVLVGLSLTLFLYLSLSMKQTNKQRAVYTFYYQKYSSGTSISPSRRTESLD